MLILPGAVCNCSALLVSSSLVKGDRAVTCCYRSLSCDGHSLVLCGFHYLLVALNIGLVRVHICQAKRCVLRTDGHEPFSFLDPGALFALAVPDVYFAKGVLSALNRSMRAQSTWTRFSCIALLDSDLSSGRRLRSLLAHGHWAVWASPSTLAAGYALLVARAVMLCLLRGVSDGNPARLLSARLFAWVRSRSVADTNSLIRMFSFLRGDGGFRRSI